MTRCIQQAPLRFKVTDLGGEAGGSGGVGEHTPLGVVCGHVPRGACCSVKVIVPVLVKGVVGVIHSVDQTIVEHLWRSCNPHKIYSKLASQWPGA